MLKGCWVLIVACMAAMAAAAPATAQGHYALIVSYNDYPAPLGTVRNARRDSIQLFHTLRRQGYRVWWLNNPSPAYLRHAVRAFGRVLRRGRNKIAVVYINGFSFTTGGNGFLLTRRSKGETPDELARSSIAARWIVRALAPGARNASVVIFDTARAFPRSGVFSRIRPGLPALTVFRNQIVALSAQPGTSYGPDAQPENGSYAQALSRALRPDGRIGHILERASLSVRRLTRGKHRPWHRGRLIRRLYESPGRGRPFWSGPRIGKPAGQNQVEVVRFPTVEAPRRVAPLQVVRVVVWLTRHKIARASKVEPGAGVKVDRRGRLKANLPADQKLWLIRVRLRTAGFDLARDSKRWATIRLFPNRNSDRATFWLRARPLDGEQNPLYRVIATLYHRNRVLASLRHDFRIVAGRGKVDREDPTIIVADDVRLVLPRLTR